MRPRFTETDLDCEIVFDRAIADEADLQALQDVIRELAPRWSSGLRIWKSSNDQRSVDIRRIGALGLSVTSAATERGSTYKGLVERYGRPPLERAFGSVELRGGGPELYVIVSIDEMVVSPLGHKKSLGNHVTLQVRRRMVEGRPAAIWLQEAFDRLVKTMSPAWGWSGQVEEYWAKVMSEPPRIEAIGRDFGKSLPGLFWLNFFGRRYCDLIGLERLRSVTAERVVTLDDGVLVQLDVDPSNWNTQRYATRERTIRDHLGPELFFVKGQPDRPTIAPNWNN